MNSDVGGRLRYIIQADIRDFTQTLSTAAKAFDQLAGEMDETGAEMGAGAGKALATGIQEGTETATRSVSKFVNSAITDLSSFSSAALKAAENVFSSLSTLGIGTFTSWSKAGIQDTQFLESTQIQMQGLTHSLEAGNKAMAITTQYYKNNPFSRFDVSSATKNLIQYGATLEELPELLKKMGNVSLSTGAGIDELAMVYQKTVSQGKVGLEDIYMLVNRGVPIWDAFSKACGKSADEVREMTRRGTLDVATFKQAFNYLIDEQAMKENEKTLARQLDRFKGRLSNMKAALAGYTMDMEKGLQIDDKGLYRSYTNLLRKFADTMDTEIGKKLYSALGRLASAVAPYINKLANMLPSILDKFATVIGYIADHSETLIPIIGGVLSMFGKLGGNIPVVGGLIDSLTGPFGRMIKIFGKANAVGDILILTVFGGIIKAFSSGKLTKPIESIIQSVTTIAKKVLPAVKKILEAIASVGEVVTTGVIEALAKVLEVLANVINSMPEPVITGLVGALMGFIALRKTIGPITQFGQALGIAFRLFQHGGTVKSAIGVFKTIFGIGEEAGKAAQVATGTMTSVQQIGQATTQAGQTLTRGQNLMKTIRSGIVNLILLAGAIVALAFALRIAHEAIPDDIGGLAAKLGTLAVVVTAMGGFAYAAGKLDAINWKSIGELTALAAPLVAFALAMKLVDWAIPSDLGSLSAKLGVLAGVIVAMGVLAGIAGIKVIAQSIGFGLLTIVGMAATLVLVALALKKLYDTMPDDFVGMQVRIGSMALVITEIGVLAGAIGALEILTGGIAAGAIAAGLATIIGIAATLALVGVALKDAYNNLPDDFTGFQTRIGVLSAVAGEIAGLAIGLGGLQILSLGTINLGFLTLMEISGALANAARGIREASETMPDDMASAGERIKAGVDFLKQMRETYGSEGGLVGAIKNFFWNENEGTQQFDTFIAISGKLAATAHNLTIITKEMPEKSKLDSAITNIDGAVEFLMKLRETYGQEGGFFANFGSFFHNDKEGTQAFDTVNTIAEKLGKLAESLQKLSDVAVGKLSKVVNGSLFSTLETAMNTLREKFTGEGGIFVSIGSFFHNEDSTAALDKATEIAETLAKLVENLTKIQDVKVSGLTRAINTVIPKLKEVVTKLKDEFAVDKGGLFEIIGSWFSNDEGTQSLDKAKEIAEKLGTLVENLAKIQDLDMAKINTLVSDDEGVNPILKLKAVVSKLKSTFVDDADSVTNKLKEYDVEGLGKAKTVAENIKAISDQLSGVADINLNVPGIETFVANMKTIVNKIVEEFGNDSELTTFPQETAESITNVKTVVTNLNEMSQSLSTLQDVDVNDLDPKISHIKQVIERLLQVFVPDGEGEGSIENLDKFADNDVANSVTQIKTTVDALKQIGELANQLPTIADDVMGENGRFDTIRKFISDVCYAFSLTATEGDYAINTSNLDGIDLSSCKTILTDLAEIANSANAFPKLEENVSTNIGDVLKMISGITPIDNIWDIAASMEGAVEVMKHLKNFSTELNGVIVSDQGTFDTVSKICTVINESIARLVTDLRDRKADFIQIGNDMASGIGTGWDNVNVVKKIEQSIKNIIQTMNFFRASLKEIGANWAKAIISGLSSVNIISSFTNAGYQSGMGFARGVRSTIGYINAAVDSLSAATVNRLRQILQIHSPSRVMYKLGAMTGEGWVEGLRSQYRAAQVAAEEIANAIRTPMNGLQDMNLALANGDGMSGSTWNKNLTVNQNNIINSDLDYGSMMADLKWELYTA